MDNRPMAEQIEAATQPKAADKPAKKKPKAAKPKAKKAPAKKKAVKKLVTPKTKTKSKAAKRLVAVVARPARLDLRLTKAEKAKLLAKAAKARRTVTSIVLEMIEKLK